MTRTAPLRTLTAVLALGWAGVAPAQFYPGGTVKWGPLGNGRLDHADDRRWTILHDVRIRADDAKGVYIATFGRDMTDLEGRPFTITGYMLPVETGLDARHFVLTRRSTGCPFCPPNEPTEAIEVFAVTPLAYTHAPIAVKGRMHLVRTTAQGLFYRLDQVSPA